MNIRKLTIKDAKDICSWQYTKPYDVYDKPDYETASKLSYGFTQELIRDQEFMAIEHNETLIAFGRGRLKDNVVIMAVGIKPDQCGKGYGYEVMRLIILNIKEKYPNKELTLMVRSFNERAIKCYKSLGFVITCVERKTTRVGSTDDFVNMTLEA